MVNININFGCYGNRESIILTGALVVGVFFSDQINDKIINNLKPDAIKLLASMGLCLYGGMVICEGISVYEIMTQDPLCTRCNLRHNPVAELSIATEPANANEIAITNSENNQ
jgi:hypothetical protein